MKAFLVRFFCLLLLPLALSAKEVITVARGEGSYPPLEINADGKLSGLHIDISLAVAQRIGIQIKYLDLAWGRAIEAVKTGKVDAITYLGYTAERNKFVYFLPGNVLSSSTTVFIVKEDRFKEFSFNGDLRSMQDYVIGVQHGYSYGEMVDDASYLHKDSVYTELDVEDMLMKHRHDAAIMSYQEFLGFQGQGKLQELTFLTPPISWEPQYLAFSRNTLKDEKIVEIANRFSQEMLRFRKTDEYRKIVRRYKYYNYEK